MANCLSLTAIFGAKNQRKRKQQRCRAFLSRWALASVFFCQARLENLIFLPSQARKVVKKPTSAAGRFSPPLTPAAELFWETSPAKPPARAPRRARLPAAGLALPVLISRRGCFAFSRAVVFL
jgi:hypothetical protein